jgi:hypothetical protein
MFILNDILTPLQNVFPSTNLGRDRSRWFSYAILAFIIPFTTSISSNLFRCMNTVFGLNGNRRRFSTFMASNKLPWDTLWRSLWSMIPGPLTTGRMLIAVDDFINPKTGRKIFGCSQPFDHAAKTNQSNYPWAQNVLLVGLLKRIKGRWACLPLAHRFYFPKKAIEAQLENMKIPGKNPSFQTKLKHAVEIDITVVCDSWFANNGVFKPLRNHLGASLHVLSRLRSTTAVYAMPHNGTFKKRGRPKKYGHRLGSYAELTARIKSEASCRRVFLFSGGQIDDEVRNHTGADAYGLDAMDAVNLSKEDSYEQES